MADSSAAGPPDASGKSNKELKKERRAAKMQDRPDAPTAPVIKPPPAPREPRPQQQQKQNAQQQKPAATAKPAATKETAAIAAKGAPAAIAVTGLSHIKLAANSAPAELTPAFKRFFDANVALTVRGTNARATALVQAVTEDARTFARPADRALAWALDKHLVQQFDLLAGALPLNPSLGNVLRWVRSCVARLDPSLEDKAALEALCSDLSSYVANRVNSSARIAEKAVLQTAPRAAGSSVASAGSVQLCPGDAVVVYGRSSAVEAILLRAQAAFSASGAAPLHVFIVDALPRLRGRELSSTLAAAGSVVTYCSHAALGSIFSGSTRIACALLGAVSVLADGSVLGEAGQSAVALCASDAGVPVIIASESYKTCDRTLLDGLSYNEGRPAAEGMWQGGEVALALDGSTSSGQAWNPSLQIAATKTAEAVAAAIAEAKASKGPAKETFVAPQKWLESGTASGTASLAGPAAASIKESKTLKAASVSYDVTPSRCVTAVVTEAAVLLPSDVQWVLSEYRRLEEAGRAVAGDADDEEGSEESESGSED